MTCASVQPSLQFRLWFVLEWGGEVVCFYLFVIGFKCYVFYGIFYASVRSHIPLSYHWAPIKRVQLLPSFPSTSCLHTLIRSCWAFPKLHSTSSLSLIWEMLQSPNDLCGSWLGLLQQVHAPLVAGREDFREHRKFSTLVLYNVHVFYYLNTVHTCRLYRPMKLQENQIIFQSAVRMKEMLFSSWRSLYYPMKLWKVSSTS